MACLMSEVIETPLPASPRNHWWWRPGWAEGRPLSPAWLSDAIDPTSRDQAAPTQLQAGLTGKRQRALAAIVHADPDAVDRT